MHKNVETSIWIRLKQYLLDAIIVDAQQIRYISISWWNKGMTNSVIPPHSGGVYHLQRRGWVLDNSGQRWSDKTVQVSLTLIASRCGIDLHPVWSFWQVHTLWSPGRVISFRVNNMYKQANLWQISLNEHKLGWLIKCGVAGWTVFYQIISDIWLTQDNCRFFIHQDNVC